MSGDHFFIYFALILTLILFYSNLQYSKKLKQGKLSSHVKSQNEPNPNCQMSLRMLLREKSPAPEDPIITRLWNLRRIILIAVSTTPFMIFIAFVLSYTHPGYQPLFAAGYYRYFSRLFIINSQINPVGLLSAIFIFIAVIAYIIERKMVKRLRRRGTPQEEHCGNDGGV